jgi:pSer/pThr/pTyr-binding forkhead associated (FHA) protein/S1-C subfamily serine protease
MKLLKQLTILIVLFVSFFLNISYASNDKVVKASESVYRIWVAKFIPSGLIDENPSARQTLLRKGFISLTPNVMFENSGQDYFVLGHGSAFAVTEDTLLTNHHVIESALSSNSGHGIFLVLEQAGVLNTYPLNVISFDNSSTGKDLALLKVNGLNLKPLTFSKPSFVAQNNSTFSIGFPGDSDILGGPEDPGFFVAKIRSGTLVSEHSHPNGHKVWQHDAAVSGGNSGGPLLNHCGEVVGVNTFIHVQNQNVLFASSNSAVFDFLETQNIPFDVSSLSCKELYLPQWAYFVLMGMLIVLIGSVIFVLNFRKSASNNREGKSGSRILNSILKKQPAEDPEIKWQIDDQGRKYQYHPVHGLQYQDQSDSNDFADKIIKANNSDKRSCKEDDPIGYIEIIEPGKSAKKNKIFSNLEYLIGRGKSVDMKIDNPFVSSTHAKIILEDGQIFIQDLDSSNGTYVDNNKIVANKKVLVTNQSKISLANGSISLRFEVEGDEAVSEKKSAYLEVIKGSSPNIFISEGETLMVGRRDSNSVVIPTSFGHVSGLHLTLTLFKNGVLQIDDKSTNGTFIDNLENRVHLDKLEVGQVLYLANGNLAYKRMY